MWLCMNESKVKDIRKDVRKYMMYLKNKTGDLI